MKRETPSFEDWTGKKEERREKGGEAYAENYDHEVNWAKIGLDWLGDRGHNLGGTWSGWNHNEFDKKSVVEQWSDFDDKMNEVARSKLDHLL